MVVRGYNGEIRYGIFKRLKNFPFKINEMALLRERWGYRVGLIVYGERREHSKRRKMTLFDISDQGLDLSYTWRTNEFEIETKDNYIRVVGFDLV